MKHLGPALAGAGTVGWLVLHHLGRTYGSTRSERSHALPGDEFIEDARLVATHAVTVASPPEEVWAWLVQVGRHRAGWYDARWADVLFFPQNLPRVDRLVREDQHPGDGDLVPDAAPTTSCGFEVVEEEPGRHLVLRSSSHPRGAPRRDGRPRVDWTWCVVLVPVSGGTRLIFRCRADPSPWWLTVGGHALVLPIAFLMSRDLLHGIAARLATQSRPTPARVLVAHTS